MLPEEDLRHLLFRSGGLGLNLRLLLLLLLGSGLFILFLFQLFKLLFGQIFWIDTLSWLLFK